MLNCSVIKKIQIVRGCLDDYRKLSHYHYRDSRLGPFAAIFTIKPIKTLAAHFPMSPDVHRETTVIGVIVYTMPSPGLELRNIATGNLFGGFDRATQLALINRNIRCISRVIIEPRFRGLGLASRLVRETLGRVEVPIVEAMAVMGLVNPFFEKAGMTAYTAKMPARCVRLIEALSMVGIEKQQLIDLKKAQQIIEQLPAKQAEFVELEIQTFLQSYGRRRNMKAGTERTRFVLSKLTERPVYYIWFNPQIELNIHQTGKKGNKHQGKDYD